MQRNLILLLLSATGILAMPQQQQQQNRGAAENCTGGSYKSCVADVTCIQSFPKSCHCHNDAADKCAQACGMPPPKHDDCGDGQSLQQPSQGPPPKDGDGDCSNDEEESCMTDCLGEHICPVLYPAQCSCRNRHIKECAMKCGVKDFEGQLDNCSMAKLKGKKASWKERGNGCGGY